MGREGVGETFISTSTSNTSRPAKRTSPALLLGLGRGRGKDSIGTRDHSNSIYDPRKRQNPCERPYKAVKHLFGWYGYLGKGHRW